MNKGIKAVLGFVFMSILTLMVVEFYIQASEICLPSSSDLDPELGKQVKPNTKVTRFLEGFYLGKTNDYGQPGPTYPKKKPKGVYRVALMGDSYVQGMYLEDEFFFQTLLEQQLAERKDQEVQVMNFGRTEYNLSNAFGYYTAFVNEFEPDVCLFFVDRGDLYMKPNKLSIAMKLEGDSLVLSQEFKNTAQFKALKKIEVPVANSGLLKLLVKGKGVIDNGKAPEVLFGKFYPVDTSSQNNLEYGMLEEDKNRPLNLKILEAISNIQSEVYIVIKNNDIPTFYQEQFANLKINTIPLYETIDNLKSQELKPYFWPVTGKRGHWNYTANQAVADYLTNALLN